VGIPNLTPVNALSNLSCTYAHFCNPMLIASSIVFAGMGVGLYYRFFDVNS
jgi:hypothetical protein